jgi:hypothetical protein
MKDKLLKFLFEDSQIQEDQDSLAEDIEAIFEDDGDTLKIDKKPLAAALKSLDIGSEGLEMDPRGFSLVFSDPATFQSAVTVLSDYEAIAKLAEAGWVHSVQGDVAQANEPAELRIRFLEIGQVEPSEGDKSSQTMKDVVKQGREFATQKPDDWDQSSEVPKGDGVGKAKDGEKPKATKESAEELARKFLSQKPDDS